MNKAIIFLLAGLVTIYATFISGYYYAHGEVSTIVYVVGALFLATFFVVFLPTQSSK